MEPLLSAFSFQRLLSNLTALRIRVSRGPGPGGWLRAASHRAGNRGAAVKPVALWSISRQDGELGPLCMPHPHAALPPCRQAVAEPGAAHVGSPRCRHAGRMGGGVHMSSQLHWVLL